MSNIFHEKRKILAEYNKLQNNSLQVNKGIIELRKQEEELISEFSQYKTRTTKVIKKHESHIDEIKKSIKYYEDKIKQKQNKNKNIIKKLTKQNSDLSKKLLNISKKLEKINKEIAKKRYKNEELHDISVFDDLSEEFDKMMQNSTLEDDDDGKYKIKKAKQDSIMAMEDRVESRIERLKAARKKQKTK